MADGVDVDVRNCTRRELNKLTSTMQPWDHTRCGADLLQGQTVLSLTPTCGIFSNTFMHFSLRILDNFGISQCKSILKKKKDD